MHIIESDRYHFEFDRDTEPVLVVRPGESVCFKVLDACCGEVRTAEQFLTRRESGRKSGPLAGPVSVEGAEPGDTLVVEVLDIKLDSTGFQLIGPNRAIVTDEIRDWTCYEVRIEDDRILLPNGIELPIDPVVGTFGNAPAGEPTTLANRLGGNQDIPAVKVGCRLYIPIEISGALFSLGDVHARQGDGEVVGAPEIGAHVTVRLDLLGHKHSEWCMIEDQTYWHTACHGESERDAARKAVFHNANFICGMHDIELKDALILLTMVGKLSISRTGNWGKHGPVVCSSFPKKLVAEAVTNYRG